MRSKEDVIIGKLDKLCNIFELTAIMTVVFISVVFQVIYHELPCPLCLYQRLGFFGIALGFLLNLRFGFRPSHYSVVILSALFTSFVSLRQIALHILPGQVHMVILYLAFIFIHGRLLLQC